MELLKLRDAKLSLERSYDDVSAELDAVRLREAETLEFTNRMTSKNSELQTHNLHLYSEVLDIVYKIHFISLYLSLLVMVYSLIMLFSICTKCHN